MPSYNFIDENTGEVHEIVMRMSELDDFKKENPNMKQKLTATTIIGGTSTSSGKLPEGFKDTLREMKKKHPKSTGVDNFI